MYSFNYHKPTSVAEAVSLLATHEDAKLVAGGQTFIPTLKQRLAQPSDVIDLGKIAELKGIKEEAGGITIGAMTRHADVAASELVQRVIPALAALAEGIGDPQVRHRGTLGGSISNNDPAADYPGAVLGLGATVRTSKREIAGDDFFTGMFETALEPDEIVTAVHFPKPEQAAYAKWLDQTSDREVARQARLHGSAGVIPGPLWVVLLVSAVVIVAFMLLFADSDEPWFIQGVLIGSVILVIVSSLLLIGVLDQPFSQGFGGVRPTAMDQTASLLVKERAILGLKSPIPCNAAGQPSAAG